MDSYFLKNRLYFYTSFIHLKQTDMFHGRFLSKCYRFYTCQQVTLFRKRLK